MTTPRDIHFLGTGFKSAQTPARVSMRAANAEVLAARCMR
jgi:hypothetical protein